MSYVSPSKLERALNRVKTEINKKITGSGIMNNDTTTAAGYAADARIVKDHGIEIDNLTTRVQTLETSFPGGCRTIANAVTSNGVPTAENASPSTIATNIGKIRADGDATAAQIYKGKTAWVKKTKVTGTMPIQSGILKTLAVGGSYDIPAGYHDGTGKVINGVTNKGTLVLTASQTGTKVDIVDGYYTHVNAKAVYDAGYSAGEAAGYDQGTADADLQLVSNRTFTSVDYNSGYLDLGTYNMTGYRYLMVGCSAIKNTGWHPYDSYTLNVGGNTIDWDIKGCGGSPNTGPGSDHEKYNLTSKCFMEITGGTSMAVKIRRNCYEGKGASKVTLRIDYIRLVK